ncbi:MAG: hypothetical protein HY731_05640 [Candidatus Tectomicrobia bacterium]|nr:hypothetical protein [Candidatus Tectomicrobia bacterium]
MAQENVKLLIPFESLADSVAELSLDDKRELRELLADEIAQAEEIGKQDLTAQAEIREARSGCQKYVIIDECTVYDVFEEKFKSRHSDLSDLRLFLQVWPF